VYSILLDFTVFNQSLLVVIITTYYLILAKITIYSAKNTKPILPLIKNFIKNFSTLEKFHYKFTYMMICSKNWIITTTNNN
jgi:hypothetical protein